MSSHSHYYEIRDNLLHVSVLIKDYQRLEEYLKTQSFDINCRHYRLSIWKNIKELYGWTPLLIAVAINDLKSATLLLRYGADVNAKTGTSLFDVSYTALHIAVQNGNQKMCELLIQWRADLNAKNNFRKTALELCLESPYLSILLILNGADYKSQHFEKHPLIFRAMDKRNLSLVELLAKQQTSAVYFKNKSPIEYAVNVFPECIPYLIEYKRQIYFPNSETGEYPIHLAIREKSLLWIQMLCEKDCDPNIGNRDGNRALHIAVQTECSTEIVYYLLIFGAKPILKNKYGFTPICYAIEKGNAEVIDLFMRVGAKPSRNLEELELAIRLKKFNCVLILLNYIDSIDNNIQFDGESIIWYFVKHCVGENEANPVVLSAIMQRLIEMTSDVNTINSVWGSLMHYLIYADFCQPNPCFKPLFNVLIRSLKCDINYEFKPKDTRLKNGDAVPVERIAANGTALSFALEMANCEYYAQQLIRVGADTSTVNWDHMFFAPKKVKALKMLVYSGGRIPENFREDADPSLDEWVEEEDIVSYCDQFKKFIEWWDRRLETPLTLKQSSRNVIRKAIGSSGLQKLAAKGSQILSSQSETFPQILCDFILYESYEDFE